MKYILMILLIGGGYYYYSKSNLYTDENVAKIVVDKQSEVCANKGMLQHKNITSAQCNTLFVIMLPSCLSEADIKYPGDKYESEEQVETAISEILNCMFRDKKD